MPFVFVSYASEDQESAEWIYDQLKKNGIDVWAAFKDINPGQDWQQAIEDAIDLSTHLLVVATRSSVNSSFVREEVGYARARKKTVIPILKVNENVELPIFWRSLQTFTLSFGNEKQLLLLCKRLFKALDGNELDHFLLRGTDHPQEALTPKVQIQKDISFLEALITLINPQIEISDTYSQIITKQYSRLYSEVKKAAENQEWETLLSVKRVLREYFEYSGKYLDGVEVGQLYVKALEGHGNLEEALWTKVKHIGYLLILAGEHSKGRKHIREALQQLLELPNGNPNFVHECLFYCHRYLGISFQRDPDPNSRDLEKAKKHFDEAKTCIEFFSGNQQKSKELTARLLGNLGNVALEECDYSSALDLYKESLKTFYELEDEEHIGIAYLQLSEAINAGPTLEAVITDYLERANLIFVRIGWIEGQARIDEQYAQYYESMAEHARSLKMRAKYVNECLNAVRRSKARYQQVSHQRGIGRLEAIEQRINLMSKK